MFVPELGDANSDFESQGSLDSDGERHFAEAKKGALVVTSVVR